MFDVFCSDFTDFVQALHKCNVEYILVGGYAVILHGYLRTTTDMDIWVAKSAANYIKLKKAFAIFGMPVFDMTQENFLSDEFDVFSFGRKPFQIDVITKLKGLEFEDAFEQSIEKESDGFHVRFLHLNNLITSKKAAGRFKDLDDIDKLTKHKK